ncbi:hypothetical protein EI94DRAFT_671094 [Lactarius quietus]|nr:hypothetical protein EI94DRAFT_671094 [Lactarius quietus]
MSCSRFCDAWQQCWCDIPTCKCDIYWHWSPPPSRQGCPRSQDALIDLFGRMEYFFKRLEAYIKVRPTAAMLDIIVKIMVEVISILGIVTKEIRQGRTKKHLKKLLGLKGVEDALQRLDKLTQEEVRMAAAEALIITRGIDETVKNVDERLEGVYERVQGVDVKVGASIQSAKRQQQGAGCRRQGAGSRLQGAGSRRQGAEHRQQGTECRRQSRFSNPR